jgi:hypothetical protein
MSYLAASPWSAANAHVNVGELAHTSENLPWEATGEIQGTAKPQRSILTGSASFCNDAV